MFSNVNYDYDVSLSDENDSVSSSCFSSDNEDNGRKFILGNNIIHSNPLEIISVRRINEINEINNKVAVDVCYESNGVHFDRRISDLEEEEVSESDENIDNSSTEGLYTCQLNVNYELPIIGRFQPKITKELHGVATSEINDIGEYCLREKCRRMEEKKEIEFSSSKEKSLNRDTQTSINGHTISQLPKPKIETLNEITIPSEVLSSLSIDVLTEFINSNKPLKEIVRKCKKQSKCYNKKPKKTKNANTKNVPAIVSKCNVVKDTEKPLNSVINFDSNNDTGNEYKPEQFKFERNSQTFLDLETNSLNLLKPSLECDAYVVNKSIEIDLLSTHSETNDLVIQSKVAQFDTEKFLNETGFLNMEVDDIPKIKHNSELNIDHDEISLPISIISDCDKTTTLNVESNTECINDKLSHNLNLHDNELQSTLNNQLQIMFNSSDKDAKFNIDKTSNLVFKTPKSKPLNFNKSNSITSQYLDKRHDTINRVNSMVVMKPKFSSMIPNDKCLPPNVDNEYSSSLDTKSDTYALSTESTMFTDNQIRTPIYNSILPLDTQSKTTLKSLSVTTTETNIKLIAKNECSSFHNDQSKINTTSNKSADSIIKMDTLSKPSAKSSPIPSNDNRYFLYSQCRSSPNDKTKIDIRSTTSTKETQQLSSSHMRTTNNNSITTTVNQSSPILAPSLYHKYKSSNIVKSDAGKSDDIINTVLNSFHRISRYNFICDDMLFQDESKVNDSSIQSQIKAGFNDVEICHLKKEDNSSKDSTTSSIDSGFNDITDNKLNEIFSNTTIDVPISYNLGNIESTNIEDSVLSNENALSTVYEHNIDTKFNTQNLLRLNKVNPFKQNYYCSNSFIKSGEEISEFLHFQWLMFCQSHTLDNLI